MNKDLHDIDKLFLDTLEGYEEKPSAALKENLDAALDKKEAKKYKKRFIIWKRTALLLLLLLAGLLIYESGVIKTRQGNYTAKKSVAETDKTSGDKKENNNQDKNIPANGVTDNNNVINQPFIQNDNAPVQQNQKDIITGPNALFTIDNAAVLKKQESVSLFNKRQDPFFSVISPQPDKKEKSLTNYDNRLQTEPIEVLDKSISNDGITERVTKNIFLLPPPVISNPEPLVVNNNNSGKKKNIPFKPFWLFSSFVSYEQAGYKLDSDDPLAVSNIKHREVHEPSFSGGLLMARQFTPYWSLQSGIVYTSTQIGISPQKMYALQLPGGDIAYKFISSSGYAYIKLKTGQQPAVGDSITTSDAKHLLEHNSIPLSVKYRIGKNKLSITPSAGIEANFISSAKVEVGIDLASNREIVTVNKLNGIKSFYWSAVTGVEASYRVNKKLSLNVQPVFRYALSPITKDNVVETFPYSFGVRAGVTVKF